MKNIIVFVGAALLAAPVMAQPSADAARTVSYADLNLATQAGMDTFNQRVQQAARRICATDPAFPSTTMRDARAQCEASVVADARADMDAAIARNAVLAGATY